MNTMNNNSLPDLIMRSKPQFALAIGGSTPAQRQERAERFTRICLTAMRQTPKLAQCEPASILGAMMTCAQLNLEPNTPQGLAYLIPYNRECQFQVGYKGLMQLMYRSGAIASFNADVVYRQEVEQGLFEYESGISPRISHKIGREHV
jgi:recombination protein RecT